jgi:hypothetical protein
MLVRSAAVMAVATTTLSESDIMFDEPLSGPKPDLGKVLVLTIRARQELSHQREQPRSVGTGIVYWVAVAIDIELFHCSMGAG